MLGNNSTLQQPQASQFEATLLKKKLDIADAVEDFFSMMDYSSVVATLNQLLSGSFIDMPNDVAVDMPHLSGKVYNTTETISFITNLNSLFRDCDSIKARIEDNQM